MLAIVLYLVIFSLPNIKKCASKKEKNKDFSCTTERSYSEREIWDKDKKEEKRRNNVERERKKDV